MKNIFLFLIVIGAFTSCDKDGDNITINEQNFLIFGHFYGMCAGEGCVETYKLTDVKLYEDIVDDYSGQNLDFVELNNEQFELVNDLADFFPVQLLNESDAVFGCPDCADGGGLFIQFSDNGVLKSWRIDQVQNNVPNYLHDFIDQVNARIVLINI
ncbi:MAG: hypothetical protein HOM61_08460 [Candidatus Marinimicrobia bacterium]|nr:hypothetical protein [Candidatus Neomarinimicrobiota bacterium]